jgi:hypothetical protein
MKRGWRRTEIDNMLWLASGFGHELADNKLVSYM